MTTDRDLTPRELAKLVSLSEELCDAGDKYLTLIEHRGGCRCCVSPPCFACSEPLTWAEAEALGWIEDEPAPQPDYLGAAAEVTKRFCR
ncbi:hypothetical protein [Caldimonas sp. KR1-144]|uniref:hypothetical protein n=1 Tax=Caldimonas sp. KR1-144 TaxID=3400911 RepID=UPI003C121161